MKSFMATRKQLFMHCGAKQSVQKQRFILLQRNRRTDEEEREHALHNISFNRHLTCPSVKHLS